MLRIDKLKIDKKTDVFTFDYIRKNGLLLYEYVRGSHCHGLDTEKSDVDTGGVYILPNECLLGLGHNYTPTISDEKNDTTWYELNRFVELLTESNPTALESLFVDDEFVIYEHPMFTKLREKRDAFVTRDCFDRFGGYSVSQIRKARGLNKKIVQPVEKRKSVLDFCHVAYKQGSTNIQNWLSCRGLFQKYCGLVCIPNMKDTYGVYYDWGMHESENAITDAYFDYKADCGVGKVPPIGYKGMANESLTSNELRLSSVEKGEEPICIVNYNKDGYTSHCKKYREYQEWVAKRNPVRYESNLTKNYDAKNMCECIRLMNMCCEIAKGEGFNVNRKNIDGDFLLAVKNHKYEYDELMAYVDGKMNEINELVAKSDIANSVDLDFANNVVLNIRNNFFKK